MSIDRPRRIFKPSYHPPMSRRYGRFFIFSAVSVCAALVLVGHAGDLLGQMSPEARVITAPASRVAVINGDTLSLSGVVVRLSDLLAPARGKACAAGPDCGGRATAALAELVRDRSVECRISGHDRMGRPAGRCVAGGQDLNLALVDLGWARADAVELSQAENDARTHRRGIWLAD